MRTIKKALLGSVIALLAIGVSGIRGSTTSLRMSAGEELRVNIPLMSIFGIWSNFVGTVEHIVDSRPNLISKLLVNAFDRPVFACYDEINRHVIVLYDFDVSCEVLVLSLGTRNRTIPERLSTIVHYADVEVAIGTPSDLLFLRNFLSTASDALLKESSIPVLNFGFYKHRLARKTLLSMAERVRP